MPNVDNRISFDVSNYLKVPADADAKTIKPCYTCAFYTRDIHNSLGYCQHKNNRTGDKHLITGHLILRDDILFVRIAECYGKWHQTPAEANAEFMAKQRKATSQKIGVEDL